MSWLGLSLELDRGALEPFSEALLEAGAESVALENLDAPRPTLNALLSRHSDAPSIVAQACRAAGLSSVPGYRIAQIADEDWVRKTQAQFGSMEIGARLWIGPNWHEPPAGKAAVRIDPGLAFGTGTHPTTRLVLLFLDRRIRGGERLLDYGSGSGILAIAAARLGAAQVDAVDIDPLAVATAAANARANGVEVRAAHPEALAAGTYDIVVSNILAQPLIVLAPLLAARTAAHGRVALSGILQPQAAEVMAAYAGYFDMSMSCVEEGWVLLEGMRR
jgi:ribosomal protein L11 methyltransferase